MAALSVIIPAFNEERNLEGAVNDVIINVASAVPDLELLIVDDGSTDKTASLAAGMAERDSRIRVISQKNRGHGPALSHGLDAATGDWLLALDADRQVSLEGFSRHWAMTSKHDAILGVRRPRSDPWHRLIISALMKLLLRIRLGIWVGDAGAPYKLVRKETWRQARQLMREGCWIPSVILAAYVMQRHPEGAVQLAVRHRPRLNGPSTLNLKRLARFCREGAADISYYRERSR